MVIARLTENDYVIKLLLRWALRLNFALGPAPTRAGPGLTYCFEPEIWLLLAFTRDIQSS